MKVAGAHSVPRALLLEPEAWSSESIKREDGYFFARKLGALTEWGEAEYEKIWDNPGPAVTSAIRKERHRSFNAIAKKTKSQVQKLKAQGKVFEVRFEPDEVLGFSLGLVSNSKGRDLLEVTHVAPESPKTLRPCDQLLTINGNIIVEPCRDNLHCIQKELEAFLKPNRKLKMPLVLSFLLSSRRGPASANQVNKSYQALDLRPTTEEEKEKRIQLAVKEAIADAERRVQDQQRSESSRSQIDLQHGSDLNVDLILKKSRKAGVIKACTLSPGNLVRFKANIVPHLGWFGGLMRDTPPISQESIGVILCLDADNYSFTLATICFSDSVNHFLADAADLELIAQELQDEGQDIEWTHSCTIEAMETERSRRLAHSFKGSAYIFSAYKEQPLSCQDDILKQTEMERTVRSSEPRRIGSTHAAHYALLEPAKSKELLERWRRPLSAKISIPSRARLSRRATEREDTKTSNREELFIASIFGTTETSIIQSNLSFGFGQRPVAVSSSTTCQTSTQTLNASPRSRHVGSTSPRSSKSNRKKKKKVPSINRLHSPRSPYTVGSKKKRKPLLGERRAPSSPSSPSSRSSSPSPTY